MSIERVAREAGFKSAPGFSNVFKKHYGMVAKQVQGPARLTGAPIGYVL
jgi:AraC-like DNA-binding protein